MTLREYVKNRFGGIILNGKHKADGQACILEARNSYLGNDWSDSPTSSNRPDIRPLNDARWSTNALRTEHMLRLDEALEPWETWSAKERRAYIGRVVIATVRELIADLPGLPDKVRDQCRAAATQGGVGGVAWAAARAAEEAAKADTVLIRAVDLWIKAVKP